LNKTSGKRRIGQAVKAVGTILLFLFWIENEKLCLHFFVLFAENEKAFKIYYCLT